MHANLVLQVLQCYNFSTIKLPQALSGFFKLILGVTRVLHCVTKVLQNVLLFKTQKVKRRGYNVRIFSVTGVTVLQATHPQVST